VVAAELLARAADPDERSAVLEELTNHPETFEVLLGTLGTSRAPDEEGTTLSGAQLELALSALERLGPSRLTAFVSSVAHESEIGPRSVAAVRILGARARAEDLPTLLGLARTAESSGRFAVLEVPWEEALTVVLARAPNAIARLRERWNTLGPATASLAVQVLESHAGDEALASLRSLLGRSRELDASLLLALGNRGESAPPKLRAELGAEVERYLSSAASAEVQAAAQALGRLRSPDTIPALIDVLEHPDATARRSILTALRAIGGVNLPSSLPVWRSWYAKEDAWWEERAREVYVQLGTGLEQADTGATFAALRELSEHPLHRDDLAKRLSNLLGRPEPGPRVLISECLARLGSREGAAALKKAAADPDPDVAAAACAALDMLGEGRERPTPRRGGGRVASATASR
jgi:HEAT repeat protein